MQRKSQEIYEFSDDSSQSTNFINVDYSLLKELDEQEILIQNPTENPVRKDIIYPEISKIEDFPESLPYELMSIFSSSEKERSVLSDDDDLEEVSKNENEQSILKEDDQNLSNQSKENVSTIKIEGDPRIPDPPLFMRDIETSDSLEEEIQNSLFHSSTYEEDSDHPNSDEHENIEKEISDLIIPEKVNPVDQFYFSSDDSDDLIEKAKYISSKIAQEEIERVVSQKVQKRKLKIDEKMFFKAQNFSSVPTLLSDSDTNNEQKSNEISGILHSQDFASSDDIALLLSDDDIISENHQDSVDVHSKSSDKSFSFEDDFISFDEDRSNQTKLNQKIEMKPNQKVDHLIQSHSPEFSIESIDEPEEIIEAEFI